MIFPPTNQTFRTIPQRHWARAAALGWRDVPWHALTVAERDARRIRSDLPLMAHELARFQLSASESFLEPALVGLSPVLQRSTMQLLVDMVWHELYEAFGGEPMWAAVDIMHNFISRYRFILVNYYTVLQNLDQNVDIAPLLHHVRDTLPSALSDLALPPTDVMPSPTRRIFVRINIPRLDLPRIMRGGVIYTPACLFGLGDTYIAPGEGTSE
jgi:hypothetical protein